MPKPNQQQIDQTDMEAIPLMYASDLRSYPITFCNICRHSIKKHGHDWKCSENCRCLMMGCIPKRWD